MFKRHNRPAPGSQAGGRNTRLVTAGAILSLVLLICLVGYALLRGQSHRPAGVRTKEPAAELISASGMILVQSPGSTEWREVRTGARITEGDLVRTDSSGEAGVRYRGGAIVSIPPNTVFTIGKPGDTAIEITPSPDAAMLPLLIAGESGNAAGKGPFIELQQIIPFGRSLELIGRVEAGSRLVVNNEIAEVSGEGLFKHFTSPFHSSVQVARLNLRVTDLAGRTRVYAATHDFRSNGGGD